jgi:alkylation response protein AidB-like acyl-CoA dehydrogenase
MLIGLARRLLEVTVEYVQVRRQFGRPVGSFQAVKHHLADALGKLELAAPVVYRAAVALAHAEPARAVRVSMAKAVASDAASFVAGTALQCHGAIGYAFENDLHLWMKRVWALAAAWGDAAWHRARVADAVLDRGLELEMGE